MEKKSMKIRSLLFSVWCMLAIGLSFTSCDKDDDIPLIDTGSKVTLPQTRAFILNEGSFKANNAGIAFYAPNKDGDFIADVYMIQNQKGLGDTGQDIIVYNNYMYVSVYGSKLLLKLNSAGVEVARLSFSKEDGGPRYLVAENGKIYVTLYSGQVAKVNPETMKIEEYASVGKIPEGIAKDNNYFYIANGNSVATKDSTMTLIDKKTFKVAKTIVVAENPQKVVLSEGQVFVQGYGSNFTYPVQKVDIAQGTVTTVAKATKLCEYNGTIYMVYGDTDWTTYKTTNTFSSYNVKTGTLNKSNFLTNMPEELVNASVYLTDYTTNGDIYRFDRNGKFIEKFESGGINPNKIVFLN